MTDPVPQDQIDGANAYQELHVPALFQEWAPRVLDAVSARSGDRLLDIACGTGVLAREALERVGSSGAVAGVDPNPGMLFVAKGLAPEIDWREAAAEALPFPDASFDVVVSQFGMMFFAEKDRSIREALRVLAPGGRMAFVVWDSLENNPAYSAEVALLERVAGSEAADALRAPFVLGESDELVELFEGAGVAGVEVTTLDGKGRFPAVKTMVEADLRGWLPVMGVHLAEDRIARILDEAEAVLEPFLVDGGRVEFENPAHIISGEKPGP